MILGQTGNVKGIYDASQNIEPFSEEELWKFFHESPHSTSRHLLTLYSLAVGINAKVVLDLGLGATTRALRMAVARTGGVVLSCDSDTQRFSHFLKYQNQHWRLFLGQSEKFLSSVNEPIDMVMHDAAHDYYQVRKDLELIFPKMRTFGMICVHDVQQVDLAPTMLAAIRDASRNWKVSATVMPFNAGMVIIRVENGSHPPLEAQGGFLPDGRFDTKFIEFSCSITGETEYGAGKMSLPYWIRWKLKKFLGVR